MEAHFVDTEFAYDVYAYGGIDINQVIPGNQFGEEREISFPGALGESTGSLSSLHGSFLTVNSLPSGGMHGLMSVSLLDCHCQKFRQT